MKMKNILKYIKSIYFLMYKSVCWMVWKALVSIDAIDLYILLFMSVELVSWVFAWVRRNANATQNSNIDEIENAHWGKIRKERQLDGKWEMGNENFATEKVSGEKNGEWKNEWQHRGLTSKKKRWRWKKNSKKRYAIKTWSGSVKRRGWNVNQNWLCIKGTYHSAQKA